MRGRITHAAGRGGPEADRSRHPAPAKCAQGRAGAQCTADLARRRVAHHHPLGTRRSFWWAFEPRSARGHRGAPCAVARPRLHDQARRASPARSTCRAKAPTAKWPASSSSTRRARSSSPIPAAWAAREPASAVGLPRLLADGVWRRVRWPDGEEREALIVAPLDSPRLTRLRPVRRCGAPLQGRRRAEKGRIVRRADAGRFGGGLATGGWSVSRYFEELVKRGFGGVRYLSLRGEAPAAVRAGGGRLAMNSPWRWDRCRSPRRAAARRQGDPDRAGDAGRPRWAALDALPFVCVRSRWRGARAVFDGLDDARVRALA